MRRFPVFDAVTRDDYALTLDKETVKDLEAPVVDHTTYHSWRSR